MHSALCQPTLDATSSPSLYGGRKISPVALALLWTLVYEDPECTSRELLDKVAQHQAALALSVRVYGAARFKHVEAMAVATAVEAVKAVTVKAVTVKAVTVKAVAVKAVAAKAATVKTHTRYKAGVLATSQDNDEDNKE